MFILEKPYVSEHMLTVLAEKQYPVLESDFTRELAQRVSLNILPDQMFAEQLQAGKRLYTTSENALDWVYAHCQNSDIARCCDVMKDKAAMRRALSAMYPDFFFKEVPVAELAEINFASLPLPCILKPSVGFFSLGVYTINNEQDWKNALAAIAQNRTEQKALFPASVLDQNLFLLEGYIKGEEYAVDMYYDHTGEPVILNILHHRFASLDDVSDRLYCTSKDIIEMHHVAFTDFFRTMNTAFKVKDFPAHVELRIDAAERIIPIEFNPLRFAGLCCTDLAFYAYGFNTWQHYLNNTRPDFAEIFARCPHTYSLIVLTPATQCPQNARFDYDALKRHFHSEPLLRQIPSLPIFGILFAETDADHSAELDTILSSNLMEFVRR